MDRVRRALFEAEAACARRFVKRLDAGVPLIGWATGPLPMCGVRRDSRHTRACHGVLLSPWPWGGGMERLLRRAARRGDQDGHNGMTNRKPEDSLVLTSAVSDAVSEDENEGRVPVLSSELPSPVWSWLRRDVSECSCPASAGV